MEAGAWQTSLPLRFSRLVVGDDAGETPGSRETLDGLQRELVLPGPTVETMIPRPGPARHCHVRAGGISRPRAASPTRAAHLARLRAGDVFRGQRAAMGR